jgi:hypothetical protein
LLKTQLLFDIEFSVSKKVRKYIKNYGNIVVASWYLFIYKRVDSIFLCLRAFKNYNNKINFSLSFKATQIVETKIVEA